MVAGQWVLATVPAHYAQRALSSASRALNDTLEDMRTRAAQGDEDAAKPLDSLTALDTAVEKLANAMANTDRQEVILSLDALHSVRGALTRGALP